MTHSLPCTLTAQKYSVAIGDGATLSEVKRRCQKHAPFLLAHFDQESDFNWKPTSFRKWLIETNEVRSYYPKEIHGTDTDAHSQDLVKRLGEAKKRAPPAPVPTDMPTADTLDLKEEPNDSANDSSLRMSVVTDRSRRSKSRASGQSAEKDAVMEDAPPAPAAPPRRSETYIPPPIIPPPRHAQAVAPSTPNAGAQSLPAQAEHQDPVKVLLEVLEEILEAHGGSPQALKDGKLHTEMYMRCTIKQYSAAREITHFYAKPLLNELPQKWNPSPFWDWLTSVVNQPFEPKLLTEDQIPAQCRRRKKKDKSSSKPKEDRKDEIVAPRGAGKRYPPITLTPRPAVLRPGASAKRPAVYHSDDDDERARKAARTSQESEDEDEEEEEDEDTDSDDTNDGADAPADRDAGLATPTPAPLETARLVVRAERIPSMSPSGPNGTWRCEEDSCNYIVRSAEEPEGKDLIAKHFQEHASRAEKLNLALSEGTKGHMPIKYAYFPPSFFVYILVKAPSEEP